MKLPTSTKNLKGRVEVFCPRVGLIYNDTLTLSFRISTIFPTGASDLRAHGCHDPVNSSDLQVVFQPKHLWARFCEDIRWFLKFVDCSESFWCNENWFWPPIENWCFSFLSMVQCASTSYRFLPSWCLHYSWGVKIDIVNSIIFSNENAARWIPKQSFVVFPFFFKYVKL